jgi:hypothetical protein
MLYSRRLRAAVAAPPYRKFVEGKIEGAKPLYRKYLPLHARNIYPLIRGRGIKGDGVDKIIK